MKQIKIVGMGMDGDNTLTAAAMNAVREAEVLIGARRMVGAFSSMNKPSFLSYESNAVAGYIADCPYEKIAVIMSGDCGFYSGCEKLLTALKEYDVEVVCGISSPVYFCSKIGLSWQDMNFVSLHGADDNIVRNVAAHKKTFFLLGGEISAKDLCLRLCVYGLGGVQVYIGENLGAADERVLTGKAGDFTEVDTSRLCVLVADNPDYEKSTPFGISDGAFLRGNVPMTKSEVRAIVLSKLQIHKEDICWDVGSGTGSVTVEMALRCRRVCAAEKNSEAVALTRENCRRHKCDNVVTAEGPAPSVLGDFPAPDKVFIGGSSGNLGEILKAAYSKNPEAGIVVTAVSLETLSEAAEVFESYGIEPEITQVAVTRTRKIGRHTMLSAENPIFIIKG